MNNWSFFRQISFLESIHPLTKLLFCFGSLFYLSTVRNIYVLLACIVESIVLLALFSQFPHKKLWRILRNLLFISLSLLFVYALTARKELTAFSRSIFAWGPLVLTKAGLLIGLERTLRIVALTLCSMLFAATTQVVDLLYALVQTLRLPYRLGYSLAATTRSVPLLFQEYTSIQTAQRVRGFYNQAGIQGLLNRFSLRRIMPLLTSGIRRAQRLALAMEARGFLPGQPRTYYHPIRFHFQDGIFLLMTVLLQWLSAKFLR